MTEETKTKSSNLKDLIKTACSFWDSEHEDVKKIGKAERILKNRQQKVKAAEKALEKIKKEHEKEKEQRDESWTETKELLMPLLNKLLQDLKVGDEVAIRASKDPANMGLWKVAKITALDLTSDADGDSHWQIAYKNAEEKDDFLAFTEYSTLNKTVLLPTAITEGDREALQKVIKAFSGQLVPVLVVD